MRFASQGAVGSKASALGNAFAYVRCTIFDVRFWKFVFGNRRSNQVFGASSLLINFSQMRLPQGAPCSTNPVCGIIVPSVQFAAM